LHLGAEGITFKRDLGGEKGMGERKSNGQTSGCGEGTGGGGGAGVGEYLGPGEKINSKILKKKKGRDSKRLHIKHHRATLRTVWGGKEKILLGEVGFGVGRGRTSRERP